MDEFEIPFTPDDDYQKPFDVLADYISPKEIYPPFEPNDHYQKPPEVIAKHIKPGPATWLEYYTGIPYRWNG